MQLVIVLETRFTSSIQNVHNYYTNSLTICVNYECFVFLNFLLSLMNLTQSVVYTFGEITFILITVLSNRVTDWSL